MDRAGLRRLSWSTQVRALIEALRRDWGAPEGRRRCGRSWVRSWRPSPRTWTGRTSTRSQRVPVGADHRQPAVLDRRGRTLQSFSHIPRGSRPGGHEVVPGASHVGGLDTLAEYRRLLSTYVLSAPASRGTGRSTSGTRPETSRATTRQYSLGATPVAQVTPRMCEALLRELVGRGLSRRR